MLSPQCRMTQQTLKENSLRCCQSQHPCSHCSPTSFQCGLGDDNRPPCILSAVFLSEEIEIRSFIPVYHAVKLCFFFQKYTHQRPARKRRRGRNTKEDWTGQELVGCARDGMHRDQTGALVDKLQYQCAHSSSVSHARWLLTAYSSGWMHSYLQGSPGLSPWPRICWIQFLSESWREARWTLVLHDGQEHALGVLRSPVLWRYVFQQKYFAKHQKSLLWSFHLPNGESWQPALVVSKVL